MKKIFLSLVAMLGIAAVMIQPARASHIVGMDLIWTYTGTPNQFNVKLKFYRDCNGIPAPSGQVSICYSSASCGLNGNATLLELPPFGFQIPIPPCIPNPGATTCNGGSAYGIEEHVYEGTVTLPQACNDWIFSYYDCCRNGIINTIQPNGISMTAKLDNFNYPTDNSPEFTNYPVTQFCVNNQFYYDQGATDADGDSLAFFLVAPEDGGGCPPAPYPVTYIAGFSDTVPFNSLNGVSIDNLTGIVSFTPTVQQVGVMAVLVKEYRNGIEIGYVRRDIQINITAACVVNPPVFATFPVTLGGSNLNGVGVQCGDSSVILSFPNNPVQCKSIEPNGTDFRILAPNGQPNPAISATPINCQGGVTDSILVHFYFPLKYGITYLWTKIGIDNNTLLSECGSAMIEYDTIPIVLEDTSVYQIPVINNLPCAFDSVTIGFAEALDCYSFTNSGSDLILVDATGANFNLVGAYGVGCNVNNPFSTIFHFDFSSLVNGTSPYYLISVNGSDSNSVSNVCGRFFHPGDTIAILNVSNYLPITLGPDSTICSSDPLPLLDAGLSGATYSWFLNGTSLGVNTKTLQSTGPGNYSVVVAVGGSCQGTDTIQVIVVQDPQLILNNIAICDYDPLPTLNAQNPGATYQWTLNGNPIGTSQTQLTSVAGTYAVAISVGSCTGNATMDLTINPKPTPQLNDTLLCLGDKVILNPNGSANDLVFWYSDTTFIVSSATYEVTAAGVYTAVLQTPAGCRNSDTSRVTYESPLPAPKVDCGTGNGNFKYFYTWNNVPGATGYEVSLDGGATWLPVQIDTLYGSAQQIKDLKVRTVNSNGVCRDGGISELAPCEIIIPNIITPNGDNFNDVFFIKNLESHPNSSLKIMNRWGKMVLNDSNYQNDWDGKKLSDGAYFYILKLDDGTEYTGTVTILNNK